MKRLAIFLGFSFLLIIPRPAMAYITDVHFYTNIILGSWCGLDDQSFEKNNTSTIAVALAWANATTDKARETSPGAKPSEWLNSKKVEDRQVFHFRSSGVNEKTKRGSQIATLPAVLSIKNTTDENPMTLEFGIALHAFQDSYAHEGYAPRMGHWNTTAVDYPYNDSTKALQMAEGTYSLLDQYSQRRYSKGCKVPFKDISSLYETFVRLRASSSSGVGRLWQENAKAVLGRDVSADIFDQDKQLLADFLHASQWIRSGAEKAGNNVKPEPLTDKQLDRFFEDRSGPHVH